MNSNKGRIMPEIWRPVPSHPHYQVSDLGDLREHLADGTVKEIVPRLSNHGYLVVTLRSYPGLAHWLVHRLVLESHVGPCPRGWHGCHADGDKVNNTLSNLRWATPRENTADAIRAGTHVSVIERKRAEARKAARTRA